MKLRIGYVDVLIIIGLGVLCYSEFFHHLGEFTLRLWDEARIGVNALEMLDTKNLIVTYYQNRPDLWNTKPPFLIWIVAILFKIFGASELTLRIPSALAASGVVIGIYWFSAKVLKNKWMGFLGSLILLSSMGFSDIHIGRTGDYDALLTFLVFIAASSFFIYIENWDKKYVYWSATFWVLAVLTKGTAGILTVLGIFLYVCLSSKLIKLLKDKNFWWAFLTASVIIGFYYWIRNYLNFGYWQAVKNEELGGRFLRNIGYDTTDYFYYWKYLSTFRFQKWVYLVPFSLLSVFFVKNRLIKKLIVYFYLITICYFGIISSSATKNLWYDAQLYPFASPVSISFESLNLNPLLFK